ncbi:hypothetical protein ACWCPI_08510 [Streptomyces sp. NPDC001920]
MSISRWCLGVLVAALAAAAGCGAPDERTAGASAAATGFTDAVRRSDGVRACALLAPRTREELEQSERTTCDRAVLQEQLPAGGTVRGVDVYGDRARVLLPADTLFLARFPSGWKVVAVGCTPRPERPYDCTVEGG